MSNRRVVITGAGVVSSLGPDLPCFWKAVSEGRSGIAPLRSVDASLFRFANAAEVSGYVPLDHFDAKEVDLLDRFAQYGVVAARAALAMSGLPWTPELRARTAIVSGSCVGGQTTQDDGFDDLYREKRPRVNPLTIPRTMGNAAASRISLEFGITGPTWNVSTACSSSNHAIGQAYWMVRSGVCEAAVAGGSEAVFSVGFLKAWDAMRVVSPDTCRPFSKNRRGMILGEGGAFLTLETLDSALARGAAILAEIAGFGMSSDAWHITQPSRDGAVRAMRAALDDAGLEPAHIGYINAHGTGTAANDSTESAAIREVFAQRVPVSSTKSMHGHALGAAGALEAVATILALKHGLLPPTANFTEPDPDCDVDVIAGAARPMHADYALSNSFAFGGLNAVLVFRAVR